MKKLICIMLAMFSLTAIAIEEQKEELIQVATDAKGGAWMVVKADGTPWSNKEDVIGFRYVRIQTVGRSGLPQGKILVAETAVDCEGQKYKSIPLRRRESESAPYVETKVSPDELITMPWIEIEPDSAISTVIDRMCEVMRTNKISPSADVKKQALVEI